MGKMKFEVDMVMKGLYEAFQPEFDAKLPTKEKMAFDLMDDAEKKQHDSIKMNQKVMMQLTWSFNNVSLWLKKLNCKQRRDKTNWPTRKAHHIMSVIVKEYELEDTMAKIEMERALAKLKLGLNSLSAMDGRDRPL
jgi:hypothetical protein